MSEQSESKDSVVFYRGWFEAISLYPPDIQNKLYAMVFDYAFDGVIPTEKDGVESLVMFNMVRNLIDTNYKKWIAGRKGGRPTKDSSDMTGDRILDEEIRKRIGYS